VGAGIDGEKRQHPQPLALHGLRDADHAAVALGDERAAGIRAQQIADPLRPAPLLLGTVELKPHPGSADGGRGGQIGGQHRAHGHRHRADHTRSAARLD